MLFREPSLLRTPLLWLGNGIQRNWCLSCVLPLGASMSSAPPPPLATSSILPHRTEVTWRRPSGAMSELWRPHPTSLLSR
jgi:hypothetical protein